MKKRALEKPQLFGLPETLADRTGERIRELIHRHGDGKQPDLLRKNPEFVQFIEKRLTPHLIGHFSSKNPHRYRQAANYLCWAIPAAAHPIVHEENLNFKPQLKSQSEVASQLLTLPQLVILEHLGYLESNPPAPATIREGVTACENLFAENYFCHYVDDTELLARYAIYWPYLPMALASVTPQLAQFEELERTEQLDILELLWAVAQMLPIPCHAFFHYKFLNNHFGLNEIQTQSLIKLLQESFTLPKDLFAATIYAALPLRLHELLQQSPDPLDESIIATEGEAEQSRCSYVEALQHFTASLQKILGLALATQPLNKFAEYDLFTLTKVSPFDARCPHKIDDVEEEQPELATEVIALLELFSADLIAKQALLINQHGAMTIKRALLQRWQVQLESHAVATLHSELESKMIVTEPKLEDLSSWFQINAAIDEVCQQIGAISRREPQLAQYREQWPLDMAAPELGAELGRSIFSQVVTDELRKQLAELQQALLALEFTEAEPLMQARAELLNALEQQDAATILNNLKHFMAVWNEALHDETLWMENLQQHIDRHKEKLQTQLQQWTSHKTDKTTHDKKSALTEQQTPERQKYHQQLESYKERHQFQKSVLEEKTQEIAKLRTERDRLQRLNDKLREQEQKPLAIAPLGFNDYKSLAESLLATLPDTSILAVIQFAEKFCRGKLRFLPSAIESAKGYIRQEYSAVQLLDSLLRLGLEYLPRFKEGGDNKAKNIFGEAYSACESDTVMMDERMRRQREFKVDGRNELMVQHLSIGLYLRLYFKVSDNREQVVIGYLGNHLDCASTS